jgi:hypothetical protein
MHIICIIHIALYCIIHNVYSTSLDLLIHICKFQFESFMLQKFIIDLDDKEFTKVFLLWQYRYILSKIFSLNYLTLRDLSILKTAKDYIKD